jgi:1-acyl-sn-glycerol-3-phosphate acyltransferase
MDWPRAHDARTPTGVSLAVLRETARISVPTAWHGLRGTLDAKDCDRRLAEWSQRLLELAEVELRVRSDAPAASTPCIVMSNHQSYFDIPVLYQAVPGSMRMVVKKELMRVPLWGSAMRAAGFIPIDRARGKLAYRELERAGRELLRAGAHLWLAPEGTRSASGDLLPFKAGGFRLAASTGLPILPVTIDGTREVLPKGSWSIRRGRTVRVTLHEPIETGEPRTLSDDDLAKLMERTRRCIAVGLSSERT